MLGKKTLHSNWRCHWFFHSQVTAIINEPKGFEASVCAKESAVSLAVGVNYVANVKSLDVRKQKAHVTSRAWSCAKPRSRDMRDARRAMTEPLPIVLFWCHMLYHLLVTWSLRPPSSTSHPHWWNLEALHVRQNSPVDQIQQPGSCRSSKVFVMTKLAEA